MLGISIWIVSEEMFHYSVVVIISYLTVKIASSQTTYSALKKKKREMSFKFRKEMLWVEEKV